MDEGWKDQDIVAAFDICQATVTNVCKRYAEGGLEAVLHDKVQQRRRQALTGLQAAHLIAVACSPAPDGHDHWTVRLLANKAVELGFVTNISPDTIHELLKKTRTAFFSGIAAPLDRVSSVADFSENDTAHVELRADNRPVFGAFATALDREGPDQNH